MASCEEFVQDGAEGEDVGLRRRDLSAGLLGRHVADRADHHAGIGAGPGAGQRGGSRGDFVLARQAEVEQLHVSVGPDDDVLGLDVAVDDPGGMRDSERFRDLPANLDGALDRQPVRRQLAKRRPLDELHGHVTVGADDAGVVDRDDVRMVERGGERGFSKQPVESAFLVVRGFPNQLDGDVTPQARVAGAIDLTHPTQSERAQNRVRTNSGTGGNCHERGEASLCHFMKRLLSGLLLAASHRGGLREPWTAGIDARRRPTRTASGIFPGAEWERIADPKTVGYCADKLDLVTARAKGFSTTAMMAVVGGRVLYEYGDVATVSYLASVRKSVLAMLFGKYVKNGTIQLDKTLAELGIDDHGGLLPSEKEATIADLLGARSGVYHEASNAGDDLASAPPRGSQKHGTYYLYSNWDFNALGTIFEQETKQGIYDALEKDLARPIGMRDFDRASHSRSGDAARSIHLAYHMNFSTRDMARIGYVMLRNGEWNGQRDRAARLGAPHLERRDSRHADEPGAPPQRAHSVTATCGGSGTDPRRPDRMPAPIPDRGRWANTSRFSRSATWSSCTRRSPARTAASRARSFASSSTAFSPRRAVSDLRRSGRCWGVGLIGGL